QEGLRLSGCSRSLDQQQGQFGFRFWSNFSTHPALMQCNNREDDPMTMTADDIPQLLRALDEALYTLEGIKRRAATGATALNPDWHCSDIEQFASDALDNLSALMTKPEPLCVAA
ncbi:MAG: hypothetical protein ACSLE4_03255, partial [Methyloceanibacter sp.]|uniref:hypothetical protein n=1 Tax=Methyloceanibacter sp. TaxID=1965321 RepID=UPI003EE0C5B4